MLGHFFVLMVDYKFNSYYIKKKKEIVHVLHIFIWKLEDRFKSNKSPCEAAERFQSSRFVPSYHTAEHIYFVI